MKKQSKREQPRHELRFRVRSRELPDYQAVTLDFSQSGVQLETSGLLTEGAHIGLEMEFDRDDLRDFHCPAKVIWSAADSNRRDRFRSGLAFQPSDDEQRTSLARTATVLQARSEADLHTLLEEAKILDPERAETFQRVRAQAVSSSGGGKRVLPLLGIYIPLKVVLEGYHWDSSSRLLTVTFSDESRLSHSLYFPHCRLLTDYGCLLAPTVSALFCTPHSDTIKRLSKPMTASGWKHYRFVQAGGEPVLELVSSPCQSRLDGPPL